MCILYTHHTEVMISFDHGLIVYITFQMILGNVLFYPMQLGNTSPLGYLPSLKSGRGRKYTGHPTIHANKSCVHQLLPEFFLVATDECNFYNQHEW